MQLKSATGAISINGFRLKNEHYVKCMDTTYLISNIQSKKKSILLQNKRREKSFIVWMCGETGNWENFQIHFVVLVRFAWESFTCLVINALIHPLKKESIFTHFMSNAYPYFIYRIFMSICWKVSIERKRINKIDSSEVYIFLINLHSTPFQFS